MPRMAAMSSCGSSSPAMVSTCLRLSSVGAWAFLAMVRLPGGQTSGDDAGDAGALQGRPAVRANSVVIDVDRGAFRQLARLCERDHLGMARLVTDQATQLVGVALVGISDPWARRLRAADGV